MTNKYQLIEKRHIKDVDGDVYYFRHIKTGARIVKVACKDTNKAFCIAFKTEPDDDSGIPHILEHSVLNGSKKYPVKSPFDQLIKGSLATFLNAMTGNDVTMYPVASISTKDYFNLVDIYLDAVFNPRIYDDKRILKQEGWRMVLNNPDDQLKYTGVVYNEMKGYYSDPIRVLDTLICKNLFPDNGYGCSSGGDPEFIPTLTQEHFTNFHKKFYHPENSYIYFYGDADIETELQKLDEGYLSKYEKLGNNYDIKLQKPFAEMKSVYQNYPADENSDPKNDTYLALSYVTTLNTNIIECLALDVIGDVLVNQESGAIRKAFMDAKIGSEIEVFFDPYQQGVFSFVAHNCSDQDAEKFKALIQKTLTEVCKQGIDKETLKAVINRREFIIREGNDAQAGLRKLWEILGAWMFGANPLDVMETNKNFSEFKSEVENGLLEKLIEKYLINNNHALLTTFAPKQGLETEIEAKTQAKLDAYKASLSKEEINNLIEENRILDEIQNTPETPEQLKCIPVLEKSDLNPKAEDYRAELRHVADRDVVVYEGFTNEITYASLSFNLRVLPFDLLPYASLLSEFLPLLSTEKFSYGELDNFIKTYTGGCTTLSNVYTKVVDNKRIAVPEFVVKGKTLRENLSKMFEIFDQLINHPVLNDKERLKELVSRLAAQNESDINSKAFSYTQSRIESYFDETSLINEYLDGIDFYFFIKELNKNFDEKADEVIGKMQQALKLLIRRDNIFCSVSCQPEDYSMFAAECDKIIKTLNTEKSEILHWEIKPENKQEAFATISKVQYVMKAWDFMNPDFQWNGQTCVLSKILSSDYLQTNVRVRGGAYGSWSQFGTDGLVTFASYRDPNLKETLDVYDNVVNYLENFNENDETMLKYIIGTISRKDQPLTTAQKGRVAISRFLIGRKYEDIQREREEILNTTAEDIRSFAQKLKEFKQNGYICVYGGEDKVNENADLFKKIIKL
ncbi:MAG: insulinase family protein [Bacteroidales bacterium]|nr:insulinase family protein [Bacteroidales bacterium]